MSLSPSDISVLHRIAELAEASKPAVERLEQILAVTREALSIDALYVVAKILATGEVSVWRSEKEGYEPDMAAVEQSTADIFSSANSTLCDKSHLAMAFPPCDGCRAAVIGFGKCENAENSAVLQVSAGYISILIENLRMGKSVEFSNLVANKRIKEIATIYEIGQAIDPSQVNPLLDMIVAKAAAVMDAQTCSLMLRDPVDGALVIEASYGLTLDIVKGARINFGEGIAGKVAESGEPMLISDVSSDPRFHHQVKPRAGVSGSMCVPLKDEDGVVRGVLSIRRHIPNPAFVEDDLKLFCVFATHASLAISNAKLYSNLHRKVQEMSTIADVLRAINSTLDLEHVLTQIVNSITEVVGFDRCCLYLLDTRTNEFVAGARKGYIPGDKIRDRIKFDEGIVGLAAKEKIPIFSQGYPTDSQKTDEESGEFLVAPIVVHGGCIGVVVVDNSVLNRPIEQQHVELLATFVSQAGIAVENARLYEAMEEKYAELNVLYEHSKNISAAYGLENAAYTLVHTAAKATKCNGAALLLLDTKRGHLKLMNSFGELSKHSLRVEQIANKERCANFVRELRNPVLLPAESSERVLGQNADLLNVLAPSGAHLMLAPLVAEDVTIGVLALCRNVPDEFQNSEFKLISIITSHAATVLKNAISYELKMRQKVLELTALYEFSKKISSAANLEEALDSILAIVADLVDYDESFIYAIDHDAGIASVKAARFRGIVRPIPPEEPLDGSSVTSWAINERKALVFPDINKDPRFRDSNKGNGNVRSLMSIPLIVQDEVVGVLGVHSQSPNQYSEDDVRVLSIIASQGAAIYKELEALSALTSYTDNILSSIAAGVVTLDSEGNILTWNTAAEKIVGLKSERVVGTEYQTILGSLPIPESDVKNFKSAISGVLKSGDVYQGYKICFHPKNKSEIYLNMSISQLLNSSGEQLGVVIIFEDITHEIKMEDEFRKMGELAAVGQLAASIAHELRNPLSSIKGAAQFIQKEYENEPSIVEFLGIIIEEVNVLNKLTTEFLDFARPMQLELRPLSVNDTVTKVLNLMGLHIEENNVSIKKSLNPTIPNIQADETQLEQVLKNVVINALQAMPDGGLISIETGPTSAGGAYVSVGDTGMGIPKEKLDRIFQPFFTTKTKGTGLGLSVVNKIIENHGGKIEVKSEVDKGTTFKIYLPKIGMHAPLSAPEIDSASHTMERRVSGDLKSS